MQNNRNISINIHRYASQKLKYLNQSTKLLCKKKNIFKLPENWEAKINFENHIYRIEQ